MDDDEDIKFLGIKKLSFSDFVKYAVFQALKAQVEGIEKFSLAVDNIESLVADELDDDYYKEVDKKWEELEDEYGTKDEVKLKKLRKFSQFKFRKLVKYMKSKIPTDTEGVM